MDYFFNTNVHVELHQGSSSRFAVFACSFGSILFQLYQFFGMQLVMRATNWVSCRFSWDATFRMNLFFFSWILNKNNKGNQWFGYFFVSLMSDNDWRDENYLTYMVKALAKCEDCPRGATRARTFFKNGEHRGTVLRCNPRISRNSVFRSSAQKIFPRTLSNVSPRKKHRRPP